MQEPPYTYAATVLKVIDGDTVDLDVSLGFHVQLTIRTRLEGINAPEVSTEAGRAARDYLRVKLPLGTPVIVKTYKDPRDKYGRWLAQISRDTGNINTQMLNAGHAVPYKE